MKKSVVIFLIISTGILYWFWASAVEKQEFFVERVVDGDTIELENGLKVRLKGINTPEKGNFFYEDAKSFLKKYEGEKIGLVSFGYDKYGRILGYIFYKDNLINKKILEEGLATLYFYEKDSFFEELKNAESNARENQKNLWKKSEDAGCLILEELKFRENQRCNNEEKIVIKNLCDKTISGILKDDATHIYDFKIDPLAKLEKNFSCIWNDAGDTLYLREKNGILIFKRYPT